MGVIAKLRPGGHGAPGKLVVVGIGRGALVAGLIAAKDSSVSGVVLTSGLFGPVDLRARSSGRAMKRAALDSAVAESGGGDDALRARAVMSLASDNKAATLMPNGGMIARFRTKPTSSLRGLKRMEAMLGRSSTRISGTRFPSRFEARTLIPSSRRNLGSRSIPSDCHEIPSVSG